MKACPAAEWPEVQASLTDEPTRPQSRYDGMGAVTALTAGPWLLPVLGVELGDVTFVGPFVLLVFATVQALAAAGRTPERRRVWRTYALAAALAATASALAVISSVLGDSQLGAFYVGSSASIALLAGVAQHAVPLLRSAPRDRILDAALVVLMLGAASFFFVIEPGLADGDLLLTAIVAIDLAALGLIGITSVTDPSRHERSVARRLAGVCGAAAIGDALVSAAAAGQLHAPVWLTAVLWGAAGWTLALAAMAERPYARAAVEQEDDVPRRDWVATRVLGPMLALLALPGLFAAGVAVSGSLTWPAIWFGATFIAAVVLTFHRHAHLLADHRRAVVDERALRHEATRRSEELEALTGLATTMTQTLEEAPIVEQALGVLHLAARSTSSALHLTGPEADGRRGRLRASAGNWQSEHPWADSAPAGTREGTQLRGGRQITRLRLAARGHEIGVATFMRPADDPLRERDLELLRLLVDQMAVAVQNARDYREKLEQAVRDPLTGLYNRRFFFEALEKEIQRSCRYGSPMALVMFDVDDFKSINDTFGHAAGDDVLRGIARVIEPLMRPTDSFARIGGEEFALLLPETEQLDGLLVAERLRAAIGRAELVSGRRVTVSGGIAACPALADTREALVKRTDDALYWAKRNGKDMCVVASETTDSIGPTESPEATFAHLNTLVAAIDARQLHTRDHSENVALYAVAIGQSLGLGRERLLRVRRAAMLHDIGKVAVRPEVLEKPESLTAEEYTEIMLHPGVGATMLRHAGLIDEAEWVRHHHERIDGTGYPGRLAGDEIPLEARIMFVADAFEAMTSDRPYSAGMPVVDAVAELRACAGSQFDARIVEIFCRLIERGELEAAPLRSPAPDALAEHDAAERARVAPLRA